MFDSSTNLTILKHVLRHLRIGYPAIQNSVNMEYRRAKCWLSQKELPSNARWQMTRLDRSQSAHACRGGQWHSNATISVVFRNLLVPLACKNTLKFCVVIFESDSAKQWHWLIAQNALSSSCASLYNTTRKDTTRLMRSIQIICRLTTLSIVNCSSLCSGFIQNTKDLGTVRV